MRLIVVVMVIALTSLFLGSPVQAQVTATPTPSSGLTSQEVCYTYNLADPDNSFYPEGIVVHAGNETDFGILSEDGEIVVSWQESFNIHPTKVEIEFGRVSEIGSNPVVTFGVNAFSFNFTGSTFVPPMQILYEKENPSLLGEDDHFLGVFQTTLPVYLLSVTIYVDAPNPFGINTCDPFSSTPTPSPTPSPTPTITPTITPPSCTTYTWGGGSIYPTQIDKFTGGSGEGWVSGSWGYGFYARLGAVVNVDVPDGYVKKFVVMNISNTGNPGIFSISVSGTQFNVPIAACAYSTFGFGHTCTFDINASVPGGIYATSIDIWGQRGTGEGANAGLRPFIWLRNTEFDVCAALPPATPTQTYTQTPTRTRTPLFGVTPTPTATGISGPATWTPFPTGSPTHTLTPPNTPPPPTVPPPTSTALPSSTPNPTSTLIPLPTFNTPDPEDPNTTTPFPTFQGPVFTPLPDTPDFGGIDTPESGTLASTPVPGSTTITLPDLPDGMKEDVVDGLETAVALVNELPPNLDSVLPSFEGLYKYTGQAKWLASGVSLQEIFGKTVYHIPLHIFYGFLTVLFISFILLIVRVLVWILKFVIWTANLIVKFIGMFT